MSGEGINEHGIPMCMCKRSGRVHAWEPGESCNPVRVVPSDTAPESTPTVRDDVAAVLAAHVWRPGSPRDGNPGCYCGWRCPVAKGVSRHDLHATHVSEQLAPLIAAREQAARAEAWADRDHWKAHAEEAGEGFSRVCKDYARVAARNSELVRRVEAAEARVARLREALDPEEFECGGIGLPCTEVNDSGSWCRGCRLRMALGGGE